MGGSLADPRTLRALGRGLLALAVTGALTFAATSVADEKEADTCLRTKIWDGYADGWGIRTITKHTLAADEVKVYLVTLYKGNEYQVRACGDKAVADLTLALYDVTAGETDDAGNPLPTLSDDTSDREPMVTIKPVKVAEYAQGNEAGMAMAVVYR